MVGSAPSGSCPANGRWPLPAGACAPPSSAAPGASTQPPHQAPCNALPVAAQVSSLPDLLAATLAAFGTHTSCICTPSSMPSPRCKSISGAAPGATHHMHMYPFLSGLVNLWVSARPAGAPRLVQERHVFEQVVEAHDHGEHGHADEERVGGPAQPGPVPQAPQRHVDCPSRQAALIQLQQALIALRAGNRSAPCFRGCAALACLLERQIPSERSHSQSWEAITAAGGPPAPAGRSRTASAGAHRPAGGEWVHVVLQVVCHGRDYHYLKTKRHRREEVMVI